MLKDYRNLAKKLEETFIDIKYWPEIEFNQFDKDKISSIINVTYVNDYSIQLNIDGGNHVILPSQYVLYAVCIKELAVTVKDYIELFELKRGGINQNEIAQQIIDKTLNYENLEIDIYSKKLGPAIFTEQTLNLDAKSIVNGNPGSYKLRGIIDFFSSIILKPINIPNASSSILGKFIFSLTENRELYNYLENRFLEKLPFKIKDQTIKNFCLHVISYLYHYDNLKRIEKIIRKNEDHNFSSIKDGEINLTSIFKTSSRFLPPDELMQGGAVRNFLEPLFIWNQEYYYLSTEWTNNEGKRLDLKSFILLINKYYPEFKINKEENNYVFRSSAISLKTSNKTYSSSFANTIYYGSPGTGKSHKADEITKGKEVQKVTFHPDYDYHSFVGGYKPTMIADKIAYKFVPQIFTKIYVEAWKNLSSTNETQPFYLQIEEINRGNCAEIFGDLFQLLDRDKEGFSKYEVTAEEELCKYLLSENGFGGNHLGIENGKLRFPNNLIIIATMNTSDQSLFPMDSAFKRRWDWIYVPINYSCAFSDFIIQLNNGKEFQWLSFLKIINEEIFEITKSQDKQIGNWFIDAQNTGKVITESTFVNKVIFYLWNDVFKDEENTIFKTAEGKNLTYTSFYENGTSNNLVNYILEERLGLTNLDKEEITSTD